MTGHHQVIDEISYNVLGSFDSQEEALDFVATLMIANDESFLDELTIASAEYTRLTGDTLREALHRRTVARERVGPSSRGHSSGGSTSGSSDSGHGALVAKGHE
jgi:hypothetical protein